MSTPVNHVHKVQPNKKIRSPCKKKKKKRQTRPAYLAKHENGFAINVNAHG